MTTPNKIGDYNWQLIFGYARTCNFGFGFGFGSDRGKAFDTRTRRGVSEILFFTLHSVDIKQKYQTDILHLSLSNDF